MAAEVSTATPKKTTRTKVAVKKVATSKKTSKKTVRKKTTKKTTKKVTKKTAKKTSKKTTKKVVRKKIVKKIVKKRIVKVPKQAGRKAPTRVSGKRSKSFKIKMAVAGALLTAATGASAYIGVTGEGGPIVVAPRVTQTAAVNDAVPTPTPAATATASTTQPASTSVPAASSTELIASSTLTQASTTPLQEMLPNDSGATSTATSTIQ